MALIETVPQTVSGHEFFFHFYVEIEGRDAQLDLAVDRGLARLPQVHLALIDPHIVVVPKLAGGRETGGGYYAPGDETWYGRETNTGVPDADLDEYLAADQGLIALTKPAFEGNIVYLALTHEAAHSLHERRRIYPSGATIDDFAGIRYPASRAGEYAAEAYSRYFAARGSICRGGTSCPHPDAHPERCDEGIIATLMRAPAFQMLTAADLRRGGSPRASAGGVPGSDAVRMAHRARINPLSQTDPGALGSARAGRGPIGMSG